MIDVSRIADHYKITTQSAVSAVSPLVHNGGGSIDRPAIKALKMWRWILFALCCTFLALIAPETLWAQNSSSSINGTVVDATGSTVNNAHLTLVNIGTDQERDAVSSSQGFMNFTELTPGTYRLKVSAPGFKDVVYESLLLTLGQQLTVHVVLPLGNVTETVNVSSEPPEITTSTPTVSHLVDSQRIEDLPLNGRNPLQLVALVPGAVITGTSGQFGATNEQFQLSGSDPNDNNYSLDGGFFMNSFYNIASNFPNPDALQEFVVTTRDYSVSLGRGLSSVSAITKSGTNTLHGTAFEFIRNTLFDAANYFAAAPSDFKRNQFGGTLGGKIIRNKLFYFGSYQGTIVRGSPGLYTYTSMTPAERTGDFSALSTKITDPTTGLPFPGNIIPSNRIESYATTFINTFLPPVSSSNGIFSFAPASTENSNQLLGKADYLITPSDHVSVRYLWENDPQVGNGVSQYLDSSWLADLPTRNQSILLNYTKILSPNMVNTAIVDYDRSTYGVINRKKFSLAGLGLDIADNAVLQYGLTTNAILSVGGYFQAGAGVPTRDIVPTTHFSDTFVITKGSHQVNLGVELYHNRVNQIQNYETGGVMSFSGFATGNAAADFLLGDFSNYEQLTPLITRLRQTLPSVYAQDNVRLGRKITVNAGIRWDPFFPFVSENGELGTYIPGRQSTVFPLMAPGLLYPGDKGIPAGVASNRYNNFAPRVGLAWDVKGDGRTSVRIGGGFFYMPTLQGINFNRFPQTPPFGFSVNDSAGNADAIWAGAPFNGVDPFPRPNVTDKAALVKIPFTPTTADTSLQLPFKTTLEQQWSVDLQQALGSNADLEIAYVGSAASHLLSSHEGNPAVYIPGQSTEANTQQRRLNPNIGPINELGDFISSNYNGLQVDFNKRYSQGVTLLSSYTWSKALGVQSPFGEGAEGPRDPFDFNKDYGASGSDIRHNWVTSLVWDIPVGGKLENHVARVLLAGWQSSVINTFRSGSPFSIYSGLDNSFSGIGEDTANLVGNPRLPSGRNHLAETSEYFNTAAFATNPVGTFGDTGINWMYGPGLWDMDLGMTKKFQITERVRTELRSMFYNAFNHPNFGNPNNGRTSPTFGTITGTSDDPRVIEFGMKVVF
jgi:hypothetical protein